MRFWIILIIIGLMMISGVYYVIHGIKKNSQKPDIEKKDRVHDTTSLITPSTSKRPLSIRSDDKPLVFAPIARNSVRFKHRPVPTQELLDRLTSNSQQNNKEEQTVRRQVVAVPDIPTNTVMLYGDLQEVERLAEALRSMDQVISTCHLKTWVVFVRGDQSKSFDIVAQLVTGGSGNALSATLGGGIFKSALAIDRLQLSFNASASRGIIEIVDQPYMQLLHGEKSQISTVEEIAIPTTTVSQGISETSIDFRKVGLTIDVLPWFLDKDRVRLKFDQSNGVVGATRSIAGNDIPELSTQTLSTSAELRMGQVIVLGGVESSEREKRRGWLTKKDERKLGHLYIVAAIYSTIPKAQPVIDLAPDFPLHPRKPPRDRRPWADGVELLPTLPLFHK